MSAAAIGEIGWCLVLQQTTLMRFWCDSEREWLLAFEGLEVRNRWSWESARGRAGVLMRRSGDFGGVHLDLEAPREEFGRVIAAASSGSDPQLFRFVAGPPLLHVFS